eukprot:scaffold170909_cov24-Tisochrysis_lutea.AAC.4
MREDGRLAGSHVLPTRLEAHTAKYAQCTAGGAERCSADNGSVHCSSAGVVRAATLLSAAEAALSQYCLAHLHLRWLLLGAPLVAVPSLLVAR